MELPTNHHMNPPLYTLHCTGVELPDGPLKTQVWLSKDGVMAGAYDATLTPAPPPDSRLRDALEAACAVNFLNDRETEALRLIARPDNEAPASWKQSAAALLLGREALASAGGVQDESELARLNRFAHAIAQACVKWEWSHATTEVELIESINELIEFRKAITGEKHVLYTHNGEEFALFEWKEFEGEEGFCLCEKQPTQLQQPPPRDGWVAPHLQSVLDERARQNEKWGEQNHDPITWSAILSEECGEFAQAALHNQFGGKHAHEVGLEAVQCAAVALQIVECLDRNNWTSKEPLPPPPATGEAVASKGRCCMSAPSAMTLARIGWLTDPSTLDRLLDSFEKLGMPLGNARWADHCRHRLLELVEKEQTLKKVLQLLTEMSNAAEFCGGKFHKEARRKMTREFQEQKRLEEEAAEQQPAAPVPPDWIEEASPPRPLSDKEKQMISVSWDKYKEAAKPAPPGPEIPEGTVTVCDKCLQASCWNGEFMCQESRDAGVVEKTIPELMVLGLEHPDNWKNVNPPIIPSPPVERYLPSVGDLCEWRWKESFVSGSEWKPLQWTEKHYHDPDAEYRKVNYAASATDEEMRSAFEEAERIYAAFSYSSGNAPDLEAFKLGWQACARWMDGRGK